MRENQLPVSAARWQHSSTFIYWKITKLITTRQTLKLEKNKHIFGILKILEFFDVYLTKLENYQILLNKISHRFLASTKLFSRWKSSINPILLVIELFAVTLNIRLGWMWVTDTKPLAYFTTELTTVVKSLIGHTLRAIYTIFTALFY